MGALKIDPYVNENIQLEVTDLTSHGRFHLNHPGESSEGPQWTSNS